MIDRFTTKYRGRRYSFGYPACPALEDQAGIWKPSREGNGEMTLRRFNARRVRLVGSESHQLLKPEEIGVALTEGFMMDPEASVSALVFHHPDCAYFGVGETTD